jgi:hypothetical protein
MGRFVHVTPFERVIMDVLDGLLELAGAGTLDLHIGTCRGSLHVTAEVDRPNFLTCRHFHLCRTVWHDANNPEEGVSLGRILGRLRPKDGDGYPILYVRLFAYVQLSGGPGDHSLSVERVRIDVDDAGEEVESDPREYGPYPVFLPEDGSVDEFVFQMVDVPFRAAGYYEFRLRLALVEGMVTLAVERIEARE